LIRVHAVDAAAGLWCSVFSFAATAIGLLRWRSQHKDESRVPLTSTLVIVALTRMTMTMTMMMMMIVMIVFHVAMSLVSHRLNS
jgi:hypothetical protein